MSDFVSTRGGPAVSFVEALAGGLAPDGGLYVPAAPVRLPPLPPDLDSPARAGAWVAGAALGNGVEPGVLTRVVEEALDFPLPLVEVEHGVHVLELFHGPTLAFKDVGARFMARAMRRLDPGGGERTVLVATSGDTGGAVAAAFHGLEGYRVVALFPEGGVSERQRRQMTTLGGNVTAAAVRGTFDDCQRLAKTALADPELRSALRLTSANSVNVGRLLPQTFYYVWAALSLGWEGPAATFVVPSGNLGNLCAGLMAARWGMPAAGFVAAANANDAFPDYVRTGELSARPSTPTLSSAMDVGDPSNLERIRWLYGDDPAALRADVTALSVSDAETRETIADVARRTGYVLDPHAAVAYRALERRGRPVGPAVVLATAHPAKFPEVVGEALGVLVRPHEALRALLDKEERFRTIDPTDTALRALLTTGAPA